MGVNKNISDGLIDKWAEEAMADLGEQGWRDIDPNSMSLIIYAVQRNGEKRLTQKITRPLWWLLSILGAGIIWWIISSFLGVHPLI